MSVKPGLPEKPQRISVVCSCGKKLVAEVKHSGKRVKCSACGEPIVVPSVPARVAPALPSVESEPPSDGSNRRLTLALWSLPVLVAVGSGVFIHLDAKWKQQARNDAANAGVKEAVTQAAVWLNKGDPKSGANVEQGLMSALAANDVSDKGNGDAVLDQVRTRRAELAADSIFASAKSKLDAKAITDAIPLLRQYVADSHATKKAEAQELLTELETATSDELAFQTLVELTTDSFEHFQRTHTVDDGKVKHPILKQVRHATLQRNLERAIKQREENRLADLKRKQEEEQKARIARIERERREKEEAERSRRQREIEDERNRRQREEASIPSVTVARLETFGKKYVGQVVRMKQCKFSKVDNEWVTNLPGVYRGHKNSGWIVVYDRKEAEKWVGFYLHDSDGRFYQYCFAQKDKFGEILVNLKNDDPVALKGQIVELAGSAGTYGILCSEIEH